MINRFIGYFVLKEFSDIGPSPANRIEPVNFFGVFKSRRMQE